MKKVILVFFGIISFMAIFFELNYGSIKKANDSDEPKATLAPTSSIDVESYVTKERALNIYQNRTFVDVDINNDSVSDLVIKDGTNEAEYIYYIYKGIDTDKYSLVGSIGAGHTSLFKESDTSYITMLYGQMGTEIVTHLSLEDNSLIAEEVSNKVLNVGEEYSTFDGELTFIDQ